MSLSLDMDCQLGKEQCIPCTWPCRKEALWFWPFWAYLWPNWWTGYWVYSGTRIPDVMLSWRYSQILCSHFPFFSTWFWLLLWWFLLSGRFLLLLLLWGCIYDRFSQLILCFTILDEWVIWLVLCICLWIRRWSWRVGTNRCCWGRGRLDRHIDIPRVFRGFLCWLRFGRLKWRFGGRFRFRLIFTFRSHFRITLQVALFYFWVRIRLEEVWCLRIIFRVLRGWSWGR